MAGQKHGYLSSYLKRLSVDVLRYLLRRVIDNNMLKTKQILRIFLFLALFLKEIYGREFIRCPENSTIKGYLVSRFYHEQQTVVWNKVCRG